jgi:hypothetical protein
LEQSLKTGIQHLLQELKSKTQRQTHYYPVNIVVQQQCANCGINYPRGVLNCPSCGTPRTPIPQGTSHQTIGIEVQDVDRRVLDYITAHDGTISLSQAAQDLSIAQNALLSSIERLKSGGLLSQP